MRLDKRLKAEQHDLSWRQIREAIEKGQVTVDGRVQRDPGLDVYGDAVIDLNRNRPAQSRARLLRTSTRREIIVSTSPPASGRFLEPEPANPKNRAPPRARVHGISSAKSTWHAASPRRGQSGRGKRCRRRARRRRELFRASLRRITRLVKGVLPPRAPSMRASRPAIATAGAKGSRESRTRCDHRLQVRERLKDAACWNSLHTGRNIDRIHLEKLPSVDRRAGVFG